MKGALQRHASAVTSRIWIDLGITTPSAVLSTGDREVSREGVSRSLRDTYAHGDHEHELGLGHGRDLWSQFSLRFGSSLAASTFASFTPTRKRVERRSCRPPPPS
jgi:hypothetical protein